MNQLRGKEVFLLERSIAIVNQPARSAAYDFSFSPLFRTSPFKRKPTPQPAIARIGAIPEYESLYNELLGSGLKLVNNPEQHRTASELPAWYPQISDLTPKSMWAAKPIPLSDVTTRFEWPVFVKGSRQTAKHDASLSIAENEEQYLHICSSFETNEILHWQDFVVREFVELRNAGQSPPGTMPRSFEFRTFWYLGELLCAAPYWTDTNAYSWSSEEREQGLAVARSAAQALDAPFLVVDLAQTQAGDWIVIECNDAQESGYAANSPLELWRNLLNINAGA